MPNIYGINGVNTTDESAHEVTLQQSAIKKNKCRNDALQLSKFSLFQAGLLYLDATEKNPRFQTSGKIIS